MPGEIFPFLLRPSRALVRHPERFFPYACRVLIDGPCRHRPPSKRTSHRIFCPSTFPVLLTPFFRSSFWKNVRKTLLCFPKAPHVGFGYPFCGDHRSHGNLGDLFQLQRPWASPFRVLLPFDAASGFPQPASLLRFFEKLFEPSVGAPALLPSKEPCPLLPPEGLVRVRAVLLSWALSSPGIPSNRPRKKSSPLFSSPFALQI